MYITKKIFLMLQGHFPNSLDFLFMNLKLALFVFSHARIVSVARYPTLGQANFGIKKDL